ncbi:MAG: LytR/AlgR family response regulator transcription factor [Tangfeifania sp.]
MGESICMGRGLPLICNNLPQMVFVSLELSGAHGFELVNELHYRNFYPDIIFIANDNHLAYEALPFKPFDFLTSPVKKQDMQEMLDRYKLKLKQKMLINKIDFLAKNFEVDTKRTFKYKNGIIVLDLDEILICKSCRSKTILVLTNGEEIKLSTGIQETVETINHDHFVKSSRSCWINRNFLRKIDKRREKCIVYNDGKSWEVPVSRNSVQYFEKLVTYPVM